MSQPYDIRRIRNVALISHGGGGKTTLAEALLFNAGALPKRGDVAHGTTALSTEPEEASRGITILPHVGRLSWRDHEINLIDTPGYFDFLELTRGALNVAGGAVMCFSAITGVKPETERLWTMVGDASVPVVGFINKMDRPRSDFIRTLGEIERHLGVACVPLAIPIGAGESFEGVVDLLPMTAWSARDGRFVQINLPDSARADAEHYRSQLVERLVEMDDELLERYLDGGQEPDEERLHTLLREAVITRQFLAVYCGSGQANIGVRTLANGVVRYLPGPVDKAGIKPLVGVKAHARDIEVGREPSDSDPLSAVVFSTTIDPFSGRMSLVRVFSGVLKADAPLYNGTRQTREKGGHVYKLMGRELSPVSALHAGEIGAVAKLNETRTGDTLCETEAEAIHYHRVKYLTPPLAYAVTVASGLEEKVAQGLTRLTEEDPTLHFYREEETRDMILAGMGQTHMAVTLDRLKRKYGVEASLKAPKVPYRETITRRVHVQGRLKKQTGGRGQFGDCWLDVEPMPRGTGYTFVDAIVGGVIPRQFIPSVEKGVHEAMAKGIVAGYPVVDVKVSVVDGSHHSVDSSDNAFRSAGALAFRKAMEEGGATLLEPVMTMNITVPEECLGDTIGDLNSRRGRITGVTPIAANQVIQAEVPMSEVLDYGTVLGGLTSGRGLYTMSVAHYQEVPGHIARKVLEDHKKPA
ncbi:MAG: elongation factor G [Magnetococcus sp. WYHC-3]